MTSKAENTFDSKQVEEKSDTSSRRSARKVGKIRDSSKAAAVTQNPRRADSVKKPEECIETQVSEPTLDSEKCSRDSGVAPDRKRTTDNDQPATTDLSLLRSSVARLPTVSVTSGLAERIGQPEYSKARTSAVEARASIVPPESIQGASVTLKVDLNESSLQFDGELSEPRYLLQRPRTRLVPQSLFNRVSVPVLEAAGDSCCVADMETDMSMVHSETSLRGIIFTLLHCVSQAIVNMMIKQLVFIPYTKIGFYAAFGLMVGSMPEGFALEKSLAPRNMQVRCGLF